MTEQRPSRLSWCSKHRNVATTEILGLCWEQREMCSLCLIERLQQRVSELERSEDQLIGERDRAHDALQDTHIALGGDGEWVGRSPPQPAPDSGDLVHDVPELARQRISKLERDLLAALEQRNAEMRLRQAAERAALNTREGLERDLLASQSYAREVEGEYRKRTGHGFGEEHSVPPSLRVASEPPVRQCNHGAISPKGSLFYHGFVSGANHWRCDVCKGVYEGNLTEPTKQGSQLLTLVSSSRPPKPPHEREMPHCATCGCPPYQPWQPIETAPTDGTRVLCCFCKGETPEVLYFSGGMWYSELERGQTSFIFQPTHWMPLPPPPTNSASAPAESRNQAEASSPGGDFSAPAPRGSLPNSLGNEHLYQPDKEWMDAPLGPPIETPNPATLPIDDVRCGYRDGREGETSSALGPNGECPNCGGIESCKPGCQDGSEIL